MNSGTKTPVEAGDTEEPDTSTRQRLVYDELYALAQRQMSKQHRSHTLQSTALAHEAYIRLAKYSDAFWDDRARFGAVAAVCLRRILLDHARRKLSDKRGGGIGRVTLSEATPEQGSSTEVDIIALDDALKDLKERNAQQARILELRYFGGLTIKESAKVMEIPERVVKEHTRFALAWLRIQLGN